MRWEVAIIIFIVLCVLFWGPTFVPMTFGQKLIGTLAAALTAILVTMFHPALRDD